MSKSFDPNTKSKLECIVDMLINPYFKEDDVLEVLKDLPNNEINNIIENNMGIEFTLLHFTIRFNSTR